MTTPGMTPLLLVALTLLLKAPTTTAQISSDVAPILLGLGSDACGQQCDFVYNPVCGSDGLSYPNYCFLSRAACTKPSITPLRYGPCRYPDPCYFVCNRMYNPVCGSDGRTYNNPCVLMYYSCYYPNSGLFKRHVGSCVEEDECPSTCSSTKSLVCGSDNRTYTNPCHLLLQRCGGKNVTHAKDEPCITCPKTCTREYLPVCGSNGVTYPSECVLESQVCDGKPFVSKAYDGVCKETSVQRPSGGRRPPARRPPTSPTCPTACPTLYSPVCGSDGRTYGNECVLRTVSCEDSTITKTLNGECGTPLRPCPDVCPTSSSPVCGSDGVTYDNDCVLKATTCRDPTITFFASGTCESVNASPPCPSVCTAIYLPVCGSDGRTYSNQCELDLISCRSPEVTKRSNGECPIVTTAPARPPGTNTNTGTGAGAGVGSGSDCPNFCARLYSPVCGSDGETYYNPCLLKLVACRENRLIVIQRSGRCDEQTSQNSNTVVPQTNPSSNQPEENPCLRSCPFTNEPVCGSNDVTYTNQCTLANARCTDSTLTQRYSGPCIRGV